MIAHHQTSVKYCNRKAHVLHHMAGHGHAPPHIFKLDTIQVEFELTIKISANE